MSDVPEGYKMSEAGVVPEEWEVKTLGEKTTKIGSGITPTGGEKVYKSEGRPFLRSQNVGWGNLILEDIAFIDDEIHNTFKATEIEKNDVFLNITGASIGRSTIADERVENGNVNQHVCIIRTIEDELNPKFLNYFLLSKKGQKQIDSFQAGGNRQGLNFGQIKSFQIPLPPLPEQQAIASALSDVDALITALERLITKKRNIKQGAMQRLLTGEKRLPGFGGEWEVKKLGGIAKLQRGASPRPIDSPIWYDTKSKVGWVRISDVTTSNGKNLSKTKDYLSEKGISQSRFLPKNSLIMSICATVGIPVITSIETCIHDGFIGFSKLNTIDKEFLFYKLKELENSFKSMGQTGSQNNLNSELVRNCAVKIPPPEEQTAIAQIFSDMDAEIEALKQKQDKYKVIKQGMMQELLTGKTRLVKEDKT